LPSLSYFAASMPLSFDDLPAMVIVIKSEKMEVAMIESPSSYQDFFLIPFFSEV
jgi:hypothetical protein